MPKIYKDSEANFDSLKDRTVGVIGYGSQGKAQALNLKDSGLTVKIGLRKNGESWGKAVDDGFEVEEVEELAKKSDLLIFLAPDMVQKEIYEKQVKPHLRPGMGLGFSHGYNIHFKIIDPPKNVDVFMVAPKSPGPKVRQTYLEDKGVPCLISIHQDYTGEALNKSLAWAKGLGCTRIGAIETTFKDETESDLIGEQTVLIGGLMELIKNGFEVLTEAGYAPELAYYEALHEAKLIMDLIYDKGMMGMLNAVSDTAKFGGFLIGPKVLDKDVKEKMRESAREVRDGTFAKKWLESYQRGDLKKYMDEMEKHPIEKVGKKLRQFHEGNV